jgi:diguanylate cyclase (GGDEF)-like protein
LAAEDEQGVLAESLVGDESIFPALTVDGRRPVVVMAARTMPVMTFGTTVLEAAGFDVRVEASGEEILAGLPTTRPDLILTELLLDDMDAVHFCSRVRKQRLGKEVPILVVSDLPHAPTIRKILEDDRTDFISTPIQWHVLVFRAHRWISLARKLTVVQGREVQQAEVREAHDTALKATTEALQLRNYDVLTGLPNRELFVNSVELALSQQQRRGTRPLVLFLDIESFREVNDLIGRNLGDELLKLVAQRLQGCLRTEEAHHDSEHDGISGTCARFVGDQFAVLIDAAGGKEEAATVAGLLLERLSEPISVGERQFELAGRVGIADSADLVGDGEEDLVQRAETALRYCKSKNRQRVAFFESFMNEIVAQRLALTSELRTAISRDELFLTYQLLMDTRTGRPSGVEGLIRWQHPTRGVVPPLEFLGVAEESDLIVEIDRWVLRDGCRQGKRWLDRGLEPLKISLNVSMRFLEEPDFAEQVLAIVEKSGLPAAQLQLELSERGVLPEAGRIMPQLELLAERKIILAIDDFGTGQTSLSYLRTLPIHCVKVDRSFVSRVPGDAASAAIVSAVVAMSHHLGLKVVAEGVETEEQSDFLRSQEYDELQGYLFSRPERAAELEDRLRDLRDRRPPAGGEVEESTPAAGEEERSVARAEDPAADSTSPGPEREPEAESERSAPLEDRATMAAPAMEESESNLGSELDGESSDQLLRLARRDFLTGLYNRFSFDERLEHAAAHADRYGHKLALLLIDLDDFKYVNDTHGHPVGDALLRRIAQRLAAVVRKVDTLARIGGDEFAVIYSEFQEVENVTEFARRFLAVLSEPVVVDGCELRVNGSLGVSVYPEGDSRPKDLLRQADLALYKAKKLGSGRIHFFAPEMDRDVQRSLALARDLNGALDRSEFQLHYQPLVALRSGSIKGVEALLRWRHPTRGAVAPGSFIPLAESTGEIRALGDWVIRSACEQAGHWRKSGGQGFAVSVNVSPVQCRDARFAETVLRTLEEHGLPPAMLDLELSERLLASLPEDMEEPLRRLEALGVGLTFDNFGSGSSALEHFQRFRFGRVKIDKSLVWTIGRGSGSGDVLSGIVALAQKINVQIVAGGIERREEATQLLAEGCELGQGYLFSEPVNGDVISQLLDSGPGQLFPALEVGGAAEAAARSGRELRLVRDLSAADEGDGGEQMPPSRSSG